MLRQDNRTRYSDDGEPHGTAGKPILDIINGFELKDVTVVVTRYFGGILLGTGGLVRAYQSSARNTLEQAQKYMMVPGITYNVSCSYSDYGRLETLIKEYDGMIENSVFEDNVSLYFTLPESRADAFISDITETFSSAIVPEKVGEKHTKEKI